MLYSNNEGLVNEWEFEGWLIRTIYDGSAYRTNVYGAKNMVFDKFMTEEELKDVCRGENR